MPYVGKSPSNGVRNRFYFTAAGGETSLSGADDNNKTLTFSDAAYVDVILNGNTLVSGTDYTAASNTISSFSPALDSDDVVEIVAYDIFSVADTVSASSGGMFNGGLTVKGTESTFGAGSSGTYNIVLESTAAPRQNFIGMSGHDNLIIAADEDNLGDGSSIRFRTDGSEKARLLSTGQLALGDSAIEASGSPVLETTGAISVIKNHTDTASSGNVSFGAGNQGLTITNNTGGANNYTSKLGFTVATTSANSDGIIELASTNSNGSSEFRFYVENANTLAEKVRIHSSGVTSFNNGIELGSGLDATDANTLDDYEEGTWTVTARRNGNSSGDHSRTCRYVKIGRLVVCHFSNDGTVSPYWNADPGGSYAASQDWQIVSQLPFAPISNVMVRAGHTRTLANPLEVSVGARRNSTQVYVNRTGSNNQYYPQNNVQTANAQTNVTLTAQLVYYTS